MSTPKKTIFISDLHLSPSVPHLVEALVRFLEHETGDCDSLYVLGDLFEAWLGDDTPVASYAPIATAFKTLKNKGVSIYFMHGNRDFLIGPGFAEVCGIQLLGDAQVIDLYGTPTLLMHGDQLCTDDVEYQKFRGMVRNPAWQHQFLQLSLPDRLAQAKQARDTSKEQTRQKAEDIMDVNQLSVENTMRSHKVLRLIHGHTHRPAIHKFMLDGKPAERIVLGDWLSTANFLSITASDLVLNDERFDQKQKNAI